MNGSDRAYRNDRVVATGAAPQVGVMDRVLGRLQNLKGCAEEIGADLRNFTDSVLGLEPEPERRPETTAKRPDPATRSETLDRALDDLGDQLEYIRRKVQRLGAI
jgi:hypothetical protein